MDKNIKPFISADRKLPEVTVTAVGLGLVLALVMCAANAYLGLYAGMTVSASIPAAVISMGILKGIFRRGTILENNIVQTMASAGQSVAAGIIFTMPALIISKMWTGFDYWTVTLIAASGGVLGVLFMVPMRRMLIAGDSKELTYPEGVACAEVLQAGEKGGGGILQVFFAVLFGGAYKLLTGGVTVIKGTVEGARFLGNSLFYGGLDISPALVGVGYIVGFEVALLVFLGGAAGWLLVIPVMALYHPAAAGVSAMDHAYTLWSEYVRFIGVGGMIVGGLWSIWSIRRGMLAGVREIAALFAKKTAAYQAPLRTDRDMGFKQLLFILAAVAILVFYIYYHLTRQVSYALPSTLVMIVAAFFFVAVSSYIVGLIGSSNNPVSGMTICTVLFAALIMILLGLKGPAAIVATLGVAGVVCCAACTAGDVSQDLKTGQLVGATPAAQQWTMMLGALAAAFVISPVLSLLHRAYGIGTGAPGSLKAPQASLFAKIAEAMFSPTARLPWGMIGLGIAAAIGLILLNQWLEARKYSFRAYIMPVAVGIYLPWSLSFPILFGGIIYYLADRKLKQTGSAAAHQAGTQAGVLFSSGLIAGESLAGILLAIPIVAGSKLPYEIKALTAHDGLFSLVSVLLLAVMLYVLYAVGFKKKTGINP